MTEFLCVECSAPIIWARLADGRIALERQASFEFVEQSFDLEFDELVLEMRAIPGRRYRPHVCSRPGPAASGTSAAAVEDVAAAVALAWELRNSQPRGKTALRLWQAVQLLASVVGNTPTK